MKINPLAGKLAEPSMLVNVAKLVTAYYTEVPDPSLAAQRVAFGTSGHRGSAFEKSLNEWHVLAISQAICLHRKEQGIDGSLGFGGEESAGASFLRRNGAVWTTDKDGIVPALLAAEITARMDRDPGEIYQELTREFGEPAFDRIDAPATPEQKALLAKLSPQQVRSTELAGERIESVLSHAPGNNAPIGGLKVIAQNGWFAARPSGTESIYKIYAESFLGEDHLRRIVEEVQVIVNAALAEGTPQGNGPMKEHDQIKGRT